MFNRKIGIITPWFGRFAGGAELLARNMARELNKRGISTIVFTTCSQSPYDSWWDDHYEPGVYKVEGIETRRFATGKIRERYDSVINKLGKRKKLSVQDEQDFFDYGINSHDLVQAVQDYINGEYELIALPYFHGLTHSVVNQYPGRISLVPCFHDEPQFYWSATERLLQNAKHIFFNSPEEKELTIKQYGPGVGRRIVESVVTGVGVEMHADVDLAQKPDSLPENYFIYAGRKERGKNVHLLCEWFLEYVKRFGSTTKLVFIGGGDKSLLPSSDHFVDFGFVSEKTKLQLIKHSKGVINLSENESFSIVIMEGWLCGVPSVVSANCPVTRNHVRRCNGGLYVSNSVEFGLGLKYLEDNDTVRHQLAANGRDYLMREFSFDVVLSRYLNELNSSNPATTMSTVTEGNSPNGKWRGTVRD
jgi:glycosyltransferase involved in cell wall biosynthesis